MPVFPVFEPIHRSKSRSAVQDFLQLAGSAPPPECCELVADASTSPVEQHLDVTLLLGVLDGAPVEPQGAPPSVAGATSIGNGSLSTEILVPTPKALAAREAADEAKRAAIDRMVSALLPPGSAVPPAHQNDSQYESPSDSDYEGSDSSLPSQPSRVTSLETAASPAGASKQSKKPFIQVVSSLDANVQQSHVQDGL